MTGKPPAPKAGQGDAVAEFLREVAATPAPPRQTGEPRGRLIFALDATASREPTWDRAARIQGEMFKAAAGLGGLELRLAFFRGFGEFKVGRWVSDSASLLKLMTSVHCAAGETQIAKVLQHAANQTRERRVNALVLVGDAMEEDLDHLGRLAGELGVLGVPVFAFQEGADPVTAFAFKEIARLSGGAYCPFDAASAHLLGQLLAAVAVYAAGGRSALLDLAKRQGGAVLLLADQMKR